MPIVGEGDNVHIKYNIPDDINSRIPNYFYYAMAGELVSIFGPTILQLIDYSEDGEDYSYYDLDSGCSGWFMAFNATCHKLDMTWLMDYRKTLEWYDGDIFDGIIEDRIIEQFCEKDHTQDHCNCYYKYLVNLGNN